VRNIFNHQGRMFYEGFLFTTMCERLIGRLLDDKEFSDADYPAAFAYRYRTKWRPAPTPKT